MCGRKQLVLYEYVKTIAVIIFLELNMIKDLTSANVYVLFKYYTRKYSSVCTFASIENEGDWREEETEGRRRL